MKRLIYIALAALVMSACQPERFREVYPAGEPQMQATLLTESVMFGSESIAFRVTIDEKQTPLSQLQVKVLVGLRVAATDLLRTKDYHYEAELKYAVPFGPNMPEGEEIKVYLTASNVEGTETNLILTGCVGRRPEMPTMYIMPPAVSYGAIGKGTQMTYDADKEKFVAYDLKYPKSIQCLLAVTGTKFGRVDWNTPVFGMLNGDLQLITKEQFDNEEAKPVILENDNFETIDTIMFDPVSFEITICGKIAEPVTAIDILTDLLEEPAYISSASVRKKYLGAKIFFDKDSEVEITGVVDLSKAYNLDWMEYLGDNKVKFLGEKGQYYLSYKVEEDYLVVEPLYDLIAPDVMYVCGVGLGQPSWTPSATSGWGFDSPDQNMVGRLIAPNTYQFTLYMQNGENADFDDYGSLNFKFFHQHGWGDEEVGGDFKQEGLPIYGSTAEGLTKKDGSTGNEKGNWIATTADIDGVYRITLDKNTMTTRYEKIER